jgi:hypothetical protein
MGVTEEAGKATGSFINALGGQPVLLVQSLIIAGVVFILYAQGSRSFTEREQLLKSVFDSQQNVREILAKCVVPAPQRSDFNPLIDPPKPHHGELSEPPKASTQDPT